MHPLHESRHVWIQDFGVEVGVVINDSFGRPWRNGVVGVALGAAGIPALWNLVVRPTCSAGRCV